MRSQKIKILFTIGTFGIGGKERQLAELIKNIPLNRYEISLFCKNIKNKFIPDPKKYLNKTICSHSPILSPKTLSMLNLSIKKIQPDIVYSWAKSTSHIALILKIFNPYPILINGAIQNAPVNKTSGQKLDSLLFNLYPYVVSNSLAGLKAYNQDGKKGRFILRNGLNSKRMGTFDKTALKKEHLIKKSSKVISMVARIDSYKDYKTAIRGAEIVVKQLPNAIFLFIGEGPLKNMYTDKITSMGLSKKIRFLGYRTDIENILRISDLSILISTKKYGEGLSNSVIEAMAAETPVIVTDNYGNRELIQNEVDGYIIPNEDPNALANKILSTLSKDNKQVISNAKKKVSKLFNINTMVKTFESIIETTMKESR